MMLLTVLKGLALLGLIIVVYFYYLSWTTRQHPLRDDNARNIHTCPNKPNCVSSMEARDSHAIEPLQLRPGDSDGSTSWQHLVRVINAHGGEIVVNDSAYLHAVFTSTIFRFRDDFEAKLAADHIDLRSASRAGTSDLGVNRKRVDSIRQAYLGD